MIKTSNLIEAIRGNEKKQIPPSRGLVTAVAKRLGCSRTYVYKMLKRSKKAREALDDERERMKDFTESKLFSLINSENPTAIIFYLKTQAKDRGYIERQEVAFDMSQFNTEQLQRIANGEHPNTVMADSSIR